jgi:internalin A
MATPSEALERIEECRKNKNTSLNLTYIRLKQVPNEIVNFIWIEELILSDTGIAKIDGLDKLVNISVLALDSNQITKIEGLDKLVNISELYLDSNQITKIEGLDKLVNISELYLSKNQIAKIEGLDKLVNISKLYLDNNQLTKIEGLDKLVNISELHLSSNQLTKIEGLDKLIKISNLQLDFNQITRIEGLDKLINIFSLFLNNNQITRIEGLDKLINIALLWIHNNPLEKIYNLVLDNKLVANHWGIIKNIMDREAEEGKEISVILPAKILLLGNHASGKSSLLHYLQNQNLEYGGDSTHLLKIEPYPNSKKPEAIFYDFGGQDYYHGIYRAFLSSGSGYLLLWDKDNNENKISLDSKGLLTQNFKVNYWLGQKNHLESSKFINENDPILLVQTHAQDGYTPMYASENQDSAVQNTFYVSLSKKYNPDKNEAALAYLKAEIDALITTKKRERNEKKWYVEFYEYILNEKTVQTVPIENLLAYYKPTNKKDDAEILISLQAELQQFHNQGLVLYYPDIDDSIVWLNPAGLVEYVHTHILQENLISEFEGKVPFKEFKKIDKNIIALLEKQKVLFKHQYGDNGIEYIIPNFLPLVKNNEAEYDLFTFGLSNPLFTLKFGQFLPIGLINQLICFFGRQPDKKKFWRDQLLFTFEKKCKVLIRLDFELLEIKVLVSFLESTKTNEQEQIGKYLFYCVMAMYWDYEPFFYEGFVKYSTDKHFRVENLATKDGISKRISPWNDDLSNAVVITGYFQIYGEESYRPQDLYVSRDDKYFVKYTLLGEHDVKETRIVSHTLNSDRTLSAKTVEIPVKPIELFTNKKMNAVKKVFISYSNEDISFKKELEKYLKVFSQLNVAKSWSCEEMTPGLWHDQIQTELQSSDIVIFMLSINFINSDYILKEEFYKTLEEIKKEKGIEIICVVVKHFPWQSFPKIASIAGIDKNNLNSIMNPTEEEKKQTALLTLSDYQFLPYFTENKGDDSKRFLHPLNKWEFREDAYTQIVEKILLIL